MNEAPTGYDVIGDIHGRFDKLERLMCRLGYHRHGDGFIPPPGRKALFLGDLVDPKPGHGIPGGVKRTLRAVKMMVELEHALCLMGNHEFNAICFHTTGPAGTPLRSHTPHNLRMHQGTLDDFPDHGSPESDWRKVWLPWMKRLPLFLDMGAFRAVHACWHAPAIRAMGGVDLTDMKQLTDAADDNIPFGHAISTLLKGIEVPLPAGTYFRDESGASRERIRAKWWHRPHAGISCRDVVFPWNEQIPDLPLDETVFSIFEGYDPGAPPVFFGHYLKEPTLPPGPEQGNVACLDHGAGINGPLVAYRWRGEATLDAGQYITDQG